MKILILGADGMIGHKIAHSLYQDFDLILTSRKKISIESIGVNSGRLYWIMDCCYAPYEWRSKKQVVSLLEDNGYTNIKQLTRGVEIDQIEKISQGKPNAKISYGEGQLKFVAELAG